MHRPLYLLFLLRSCGVRVPSCSFSKLEGAGPTGLCSHRLQSSLLWDEVYGYLKLFSLESSAFPEVSSMQSRSLGWAHMGESCPMAILPPVLYWQDPLVCQLHRLLFIHFTAIKDSDSSGTGAKRAVGFFSPSHWSCLPPHHIAPTLLLVCEGLCQRMPSGSAASDSSDPSVTPVLSSIIAIEPVRCVLLCCPFALSLYWAFEPPLKTQLKVFVWEKERKSQN